MPGDAGEGSCAAEADARGTSIRENDIDEQRASDSVAPRSERRPGWSEGRWG
jgi:hypothetical protein